MKGRKLQITNYRERKRRKGRANIQKVIQKVVGSHS